MSYNHAIQGVDTNSHQHHSGASIVELPIDIQASPPSITIPITQQPRDHMLLQTISLVDSALNPHRLQSPSGYKLIGPFLVFHPKDDYNPINPPRARRANSEPHLPNDPTNDQTVFDNNETNSSNQLHKHPQAHRHNLEHSTLNIEPKLCNAPASLNDPLHMLADINGDNDVSIGTSSDQIQEHRHNWEHSAFNIEANPSNPPVPNDDPLHMLSDANGDDDISSIGSVCDFLFNQASLLPISGNFQDMDIILPNNNAILPTERDVLFQRGKRTIKNPGNKFYRSLIRMYAELYHAAMTPVEKKKIIQDILTKLISKGHRLVTLEECNGRANTWTCFVCSPQVQQKKVCQALRDTHRQLGARRNQHR